MLYPEYTIIYVAIASLLLCIVLLLRMSLLFGSVDVDSVVDVVYVVGVCSVVGCTTVC